MSLSNDTLRAGASPYRTAVESPDCEGRAGRIAAALPSTSSGQVWEHVIRDEQDYARHVDHVHYNPVKHGYVTRVADWPHSTFHRHVERGLYPPNWGGASDSELKEGERG